MNFKSFSIMFLLALSAVSSTLVNRGQNCSNEEGKCTEKEPRTKLYPLCMYEKERSKLWCNHSNYTKIPDPDDVEKEIYQSCKSATILDISDSCLRKLDKSDLAKYPNMKTFKCRENLISTIQPRLFESNEKLEVLDLCTNTIKTIKTDSFRGLENLDTLILDNNDLEELQEGMFTGLSSLKKLTIHNNDIAVLHGRPFSRLRRLEVLVLTGNRIAHIDEEAFEGLESLTTLQLDENKLREVGRGTFAKLPNLQILSLSYNEFVTWPDFEESAMANLHTLNLGHNMLEEIKSSNIANLSKLQNLSLENNSLHTLPDDLHLHTPNLRYLNISKNHFEAIGEFAFTELNYLETLDLRDNGLTTPYAEWFSRVTENGLAIANVTSGNEWKCDCGVIQYQEFLTKQDIKWQKALRITCHSPKKIVLHVSKVLNARVVEAIQANHDCGKTEPFVKSERKTNATYPFTKTEIITYHSKTREDTATEVPTTTAQSATRREGTHDFMERRDLQTPTMERVELDTAAIALFATALALILVIIALSAFCIMRKRQVKAHNLKHKQSFREDSRADVEAGVEQRLLPHTIPAIQVNSHRSPIVSTQSETPQGSAQGEGRPPSSTTESAADPTYMTMQTVPNENTIPKEIGSGEANHEQHLQPWPPGPRRQPEGSSFKKDDI